MTVEGTEKDARIRNLRFSIAKELIRRELSLEDVYSEKELMEYFYFAKKDIVYNTNVFFDKTEEGYRFSLKGKSNIKKILEMHELAVPYLESAQIIFLKKFGSYYEESEKNSFIHFEYEKFHALYNELKDVMPVLHWGKLPIIKEQLMINENQLPENDLIYFYNSYYALEIMLKELKGDGVTMEINGDDTLDRDMDFTVYTRRWGHTDTYHIKRTIDGWEVRHIAINGSCEKMEVEHYLRI